LINYKEVLFLIYVNNKKENVIYSELGKLLDYNYAQLDEFIEKMLDLKYIVFNDYFEISEKGNNLLIKYGLKDVLIKELCEKKNTKNYFIGEKIGLNEIYVPTNFSLKFKGYKV